MKPEIRGEGWKPVSDGSYNESRLNNDQKIILCLRISENDGLMTSIESIADGGGFASKPTNIIQSNMQFNPIQSNPIQFNPIQPNPIIQSNPIQSNSIQFNPIQSNPIHPIHSNPIQLATQQLLSNPIQLNILTS